ncbi:DUF3772 domain-containing protein [Sphingomonas glacialis]|uniref:Mechanosensitive ion channel family protein n=1 Tax=Sphingomonas glacialis TaxID=658225 RepID=A0A502FFI6_9SPHN|nr:DUF3772 domain-containing protein [Sphingomonas glacialis]TPG48207.1 mechanosensitive ion channel family protein [Sphingomonas glacialis]
MSKRLLGALALSLLIAAPSVAQTPAAPLSTQLAGTETELRAIDRALDGRVDADAQKSLRSRALAAQQVAKDVGDGLDEQITLLDARLAGLGPPAAGVTEAPDIKAQRMVLTQQRSALDATSKRAGLASIEAQQLVDEIEQSREQQFNEKISAQAASPLGPAFWKALLASLPRDIKRIGLFLSQGIDQIGSARDAVPWQALLGAVFGFVFFVPLRIWARALGQKVLVEGAPGRRVRRSANALWRVIVGTLCPLLAAMIVTQGLRWSGLLPARWNGMGDAVVLATGFSAFTAAVSGALLMRRQPSWRIAAIDDETAARMRPLTWILAALSFVTILLSAFDMAIGASQAAQVASQTLIAVLHLLLIATFLLVLGRLRAARSEYDDAASTTASAGIGIVLLVVWMLIVIASIALVMGYIAFSLFTAQLIAWAAILSATLYLMTAAVDDVATSAFTRSSRLGVMLTRALRVRGSVVDQFGVLLSAFLRLVLVCVALGMLVSPFGGSGGLGAVFGRLGVLAQGIEVGGVSISPATIVRGAVVLAIGLGLTRAFMGWLENRYLPITDLDGSGRNSVSLVARYVAIAIAFIWALASLGIGIEHVALLLSALSVGIGFGLQAITQNFVSGLILLAERPIKIGDLVRVGNDEGDVKRISVRSTEIELADHSTLIVPNSELITKSVLNKTMAGPLGRIQIKFSVPLDTDASKVRGMVQDAFASDSAVLDEPAPKVFIDGLTEGRIEFNCFGHVANQRAVYAARSTVLMTLLDQFRAAGIDIGTVPQRLELVAAGTDLAAIAP